NPGINAHYKKNPEAETWIPRFERESREIFNVRYEILSAMNIKPGMSVADVGAGTGLFTGMIAEKVGPTGKVYAVDVVPKFLSYIEKRTAKDGYKNVTTVLCEEDSVSLPEASVDVMFICDTYHHFEYPTRSLQSIWKAMRPEGIVFVVDFNTDTSDDSFCQERRLYTNNI
ncbi:MAG: methyltransferase domain-containing protein, partial [Sulfurovum sp.]|nr:methyltransferase domain-containing protein [Sulfurovum sp.]